MNTSKPDKTIDQLFEEFLADQEARLGSKTFDKYEGIIHLYRSYLERYWPDHSGKEYDAITKAKAALWSRPHESVKLPPDTELPILRGGGSDDPQ